MVRWRLGSVISNFKKTNKQTNKNKNKKNRVRGHKEVCLVVKTSGVLISECSRGTEGSPGRRKLFATQGRRVART